MRQLITRMKYNVGFGGATCYLNLGGRGDATFIEGTGTFNRFPWASAGTFRNLTVYCPGTHASTVVTVQVNGVNSALTCTIGASDTIVTDVVHTATVTLGQVVVIKAVTTQGAGFDLAFAVEFDGDSQVYGLQHTASSMSAIDTVYAGALGNGNWSGSVGGTGDSNTYSICAVPGTITSIQLASANGAAPGVGNTWVCRLAVNGVVQDGAGATVNTTCTINNPDTTASSTFTLPIALQEHVEFRVTRTGAGFLLTEVAPSCAFTPTDAQSFMLVGGSNNTLGTAVWNQADQGVLTNARATVPAGPEPLVLQGLYGEQGSAPGGSLTLIYTLLKNNAASAMTYTITGASTAGSTTTAVSYISPDTLTIDLTGTGSFGSQYHWGIAAILLNEPAPVLTTFTKRWTRRAPILSSENKQQFFHRLEIEMEGGVGLSTGQGDTPQAMLRFSNDSGHTWSSELWASIGALGAWGTRIFWTRLGSGRNRVFEVSGSDPVNTVLLKATIEADEGTS